MSKFKKVLSKIKNALSLSPDQAAMLLGATEHLYDDAGPKPDAHSYQDGGPPGSAAQKAYQDGGPPAFHQGMAELAGATDKNKMIKELLAGLPPEPKATPGELKSHPNKGSGFLARMQPKTFAGMSPVSKANWLENADTKHRMGPALNHFYKVYRTKPTQLGFFDWVDTLSYFEVVKAMQEGGWPEHFIRLAAPAFMKGVKYMGRLERAEYQVTIKDGKLMSGDEPFDTLHNQTIVSGSNWAIWVMSPGGMLYSGDHKKGTLHHSGFLSGGVVKCAGEWKVTDGVPICISAKSGHYTPTVDQFAVAMGNLKSLGLLLDKTMLVLKKLTAAKAELVEVDRFLKLSAKERGAYTTNFNYDDLPYRAYVNAEHQRGKPIMGTHRQA